MAAVDLFFDYISRLENYKSVILVSIPMFLWSKNLIKTSLAALINPFIPNLHKFA